MLRYCALLTTGLQRTMRPLIDADFPLQQNRSQRQTRVHVLLSAEYSAKQYMATQSRAHAKVYAWQLR